jgi:hypothetical protein
MQGYVDIIIKNENIVRQDGAKRINDCRIFEFVLNCQISLQKLMESDSSSIVVNCGDYWSFQFYRKEDKAYISLFDEIDKRYVFQDKELAFKDFLQEILSASVIFSVELRNSFFIYNMQVRRYLDKVLMHNATYSVRCGILTEDEIKDIFIEFLSIKSYTDYLT